MFIIGNFEEVKVMVVLLQAFYHKLHRNLLSSFLKSFDNKVINLIITQAKIYQSTLLGIKLETIHLEAVGYYQLS